MSRRQCRRCRRKLAITSFRRKEDGERSSCCRHCETAINLERKGVMSDDYEDFGVVQRRIGEWVDAVRREHIDLAELETRILIVLRKRCLPFDLGPMPAQIRTDLRSPVQDSGPAAVGS